MRCRGGCPGRPRGSRRFSLVAGPLSPAVDHWHRWGVPHRLHRPGAWAWSADRAPRSAPVIRAV